MVRVRQTVFGLLGFSLLAVSVLAAVVFRRPGFYILFCLSLVAVLEFLHLWLRKESFLEGISCHRRRTLGRFALIAILIAFVVDFVYGVWLFRVWIWPTYHVLQWVLLYTVINLASFLIAYGAFLLLSPLFLAGSPDGPSGKRMALPRARQDVRRMLWLSVAFLILPAAYFLLFGTAFGGFVMFLPFIGIWLLCDALLASRGRISLLRRMRQGEKGLVLSVLVTTLVLAVVQEGFNAFAPEWIYVNIPFMQFQLAGVPVLVIIGWIPLVLFYLSFVTLLRTEK